MMPVDRSRDVSRPVGELHENERLKLESRFLRGTIEQGLADRVTGAFNAPDTQLTKFHGFYQQDDRDLRDERRRQKLEPAYQMMVRLRLPGGVVSTDQWLALDDIAGRYADSSLRLTTRQTFQFHGVLKHHVKPLIRALEAVRLDSRAACGDVNRTVMAAANPGHSVLHDAVYESAKLLSDHFAPRTAAYGEIWLDQERVDSDRNEEPIYGATYLPRKFKIGLAVPPVNDIDVFSQDLGLIAIDQSGVLEGFNVCVGGGMGRTDNDPRTYPRLADVIGFCRPEQLLSVAEAVIGVQRDFGDRVDRSQARLKYTIDRYGLAWFKTELESRLGFELEPSRPFGFTRNGDQYGWSESDDGLWQYTLFVENGRIRDGQDVSLRSALRELARMHEGEFRLTPNQNLIVARVRPEAKASISDLFAAHGVDPLPSPLRGNAMACVALPTCGLAMAESERYLPGLLTRLEALMESAGIGDVPIVIRMTGCPNGCARPYLAEIGFTGRAPGKYNVYLGGAFDGSRLNQLYLENVGEERILAELSGILARFASEREPGETFGDFVFRGGYVSS